MKTIIQASVLFVLIILITLSSISFVTHNALKDELISSVSNGAEQTMNLMYIYKAYSYDSYDEVIYDVLQNIILSKSSDSTLTVNIYNKSALANGILDIEAIEHYQGLGGVARKAEYRVRIFVYQSPEGSTYIKYAEPDTNANLSEQWVFTSEDITNIKNFLLSSEGNTPSFERNCTFWDRFSSCKQ